MYKHSKIAVASAITVLVVLGLAFVSIQPPVTEIDPEIELENPRFIITTWDYPDAYDQGIEAIEIYENSTGSWELHDNSPLFYDDPASQSTLDWEVGVGIRLDVYTMLNSTLVGVGSRTEGRLYHRHYIIVTDSADQVVWYQQNLTYYGSSEDTYPLYLYDYRVTLGFLPAMGQIYTIEIMYEIYY